MSALPDFRGWTVDERLREFRRVKFTRGVPSMETVPFSSAKGAMMLAEYNPTSYRGGKDVTDIKL